MIDRRASPGARVTASRRAGRRLPRPGVRWRPGVRQLARRLCPPVARRIASSKKGVSGLPAILEAPGVGLATSRAFRRASGSRASGSGTGWVRTIARGSPKLRWTRTSSAASAGSQPGAPAVDRRIASGSQALAGAITHDENAPGLQRLEGRRQIQDRFHPGANNQDRQNSPAHQDRWRYRS